MGVTPPIFPSRRVVVLVSGVHAQRRVISLALILLTLAGLSWGMNRADEADDSADNGQAVHPSGRPAGVQATFATSMMLTSSRDDHTPVRGSESIIPMSAFFADLPAPSWGDSLWVDHTQVVELDDLLAWQSLLFASPFGEQETYRRDYSDPTAGGAVPLMMVAGREREPLSPHFRVGDFVARDGAAFARISPLLVSTLDSITALAEGRIVINSGYRHPTINFDPEIGGAALSQHMAGQAADIWSPAHTPVELAELALMATGCRIGIGLGRNFIHIDVRGYLTSWARYDASMDEVDFDLWVLERCGAESGAFDRGNIAAFERGLREGEFHSITEYATTYHEVMAAYARIKQRKGQRGVVLLDLRRSLNADAPQYYLSFLSQDNPLMQQYGVASLLSSCTPSRYFCYLIIGPNGTPEKGIMSL